MVNSELFHFGGEGKVELIMSDLKPVTLVMWGKMENEKLPAWDDQFFQPPPPSRWSLPPSSTEIENLWTSPERALINFQRFSFTMTRTSWTQGLEWLCLIFGATWTPANLPWVPKSVWVAFLQYLLNTWIHKIHLQVWNLMTYYWWSTWWANYFSSLLFQAEVAGLSLTVRRLNQLGYQDQHDLLKSVITATLQLTNSICVHGEERSSCVWQIINSFFS